MSEIPIGACPVCGGAAMKNPFNTRNVMCAGSCDMELPVADWNRLSGLAAEVARLRAALERYADASNWSPHAEYCGCLWTGSAEGAEIARNILEAPDAD